MFNLNFAFATLKQLLLHPSAIAKLTQGTDAVANQLDLKRRQKWAAGWNPKLDDAMADMGINRIDMLKVDVEGAELEFFEGAERSIYRSLKHIIFEWQAHVWQKKRAPTQVWYFWISH